MALVKCSGCGAEISPDAVACPKCGHPKAKQKALAMRPSGCAALFIGVVGVFFVVSVVRGCTAPPPPTRLTVVPVSPTVRPTPRNTPTESEKVAAKKEEAKLAAANLKDEIETRRSFGPKLRQTFLDRRIDVKVRVEGKNAERLVLTFVLFNDVWVNDFQKGELIGEIRGRGFKSIDFTDGYNYAVRLPL